VILECKLLEEMGEVILLRYYTSKLLNYREQSVGTIKEFYATIQINGEKELNLNRGNMTLHAEFGHPT
jgi:hypothetical protein